MNLLERAQAARELAAQADAIVQAATAAETIEERASDLRKLRVGLTNAVARRAVLGLFTIGVARWPAPVKAVAAAAGFREAVAAAPTGGRAEFQKLVASLKKVVESAEEAVATAITDARKSLRDDARALDDLALVEGFGERATRVSREIAELLAQDWGRADGPTLERHLARRVDLQKQLDALAQQDVPAAVRAFFRAARADGAPLELLTAEVLAWLEQRGQRERLRLFLK